MGTKKLEGPEFFVFSRIFGCKAQSVGIRTFCRSETQNLLELKFGSPEAPATTCDPPSAEATCGIDRPGRTGNIRCHLKAVLRATKAIPFVGFYFDRIVARSQAEDSCSSDFISRNFSNSQRRPALTRRVRPQPDQPAIDALTFSYGIG